MIPSHTKAVIDRYVRDHCPTGGFLYAVLTNDLFEAVARADEYNRECLSDICEYIQTHIPSIAWGNPEKVRQWLEPYKP